METVLPEARQQGFIALLDQVYASGQAYRGDELPLQWSPDGQGPLQQGYFDLVYQPLLSCGCAAAPSRCSRRTASCWRPS